MSGSDTQKSSLNAQQQQAYEHVEGPMLVVAGAGSGKTRVVTERIHRLITLGVPASAILVVTFTNKAAGEMRERVAALGGGAVTVCTFHSLGVRILRECAELLGFESQMVIYDQDDSLRAIVSCLQDLAVDSRKEVAKSLQSMISNAKNGMIAPSEVDESELVTETEQLFPRVYHEYQQKLKLCAAVDFDDLLFLSVRILREHPEVLKRYQDRWSFFSVDEFQDTNAAQYTLIGLLAGKSRNLCVVGDPDQSIYSWRGADIRNILDFSRDYPDALLVRLEQNYRSTNTILQAANGVIEHNSDRLEKHLWSGTAGGDPVQLIRCDSERSEAEYVVSALESFHLDKQIPYHEIAIFYRTNFQSRIFEDVLLREGIPYVVYGGVSFYQRKEVKDVMAYLRIVFSPADLMAFGRTVNMPKRGLGDKTVGKIAAGAAEAELPIRDYCQQLLEGSVANIKVTARQKQGLQSYLQTLCVLNEALEQGCLSDLVRAAIEQTGYLDVLKADPLTFDDRKGNLDELFNKAKEWEQERPHPTLGDFLEELSLKGSADVDDDGDSLSMMTVHNSKGLEFDTCFLVGMEEGLFPYFNSRETEQAVEEERRLCYVGMTRARRRLIMSYATGRMLWGAHRRMPKSRFLKELPSEYVQTNLPGRFDSSPPFQSHQSDGEFYEEFSAEECEVGSRIAHRDFGAGTVKKIYDTQMGLTFDVEFDNLEYSKSLVVRYAQLSWAR